MNGTIVTWFRSLSAYPMSAYLVIIVITGSIALLRTRETIRFHRNKKKMGVGAGGRTPAPFLYEVNLKIIFFENCGKDDSP